MQGKSYLNEQKTKQKYCLHLVTYKAQFVKAFNLPGRTMLNIHVWSSKT